MLPRKLLRGFLFYLALINLVPIAISTVETNYPMSKTSDGQKAKVALIFKVVFIVIFNFYKEKMVEFNVGDAKRI
jgi:hypothetical protein